MTYEMAKDKSAAPVETVLHRAFMREPGWHVTMKVGSEKAFCYQIAPGDATYHRLLNGEILVVRGDERLCLPCAERRGLITFAAKPLREPASDLEIESAEAIAEYDVSE